MAARWNESEYLERAKMVAKQHVTTGTPINDLTEKVAREACMTPDEIRTLVRISNVEAFRAHFDAKKEADDRNVEYEVGDAEAVLRRMVDGAKPMPGMKVAAEQLPLDLIPNEREVERYGEVPETEKVAFDENPPEKELPRERKIMGLRKVAEDLEVEIHANEQLWKDKLAHVEKYFHRAEGYGSTFEQVEHEALSLYGQKIAEDLSVLRNNLRLPAATDFFAKLAYAQEHVLVSEPSNIHKDILKLSEYREAYEKNTAALLTVQTRLSDLNG